MASRVDKDAALVAVMARWRFDPCRFAIEGLGYEVSNQQRVFFAAVGGMFRAKYRASTGEKLTAREAELARKRGISVSSGHGIGKDFSLAVILIWLLAIWSTKEEPATGLVTGPNLPTLKSVLWKEFRRHIRQGKFHGEEEGWLARFFEIQTDKIIHKELVGESFIEARTANVTGSAEEQGEALAGRHEQYMILAVDEASGVSDGVFKPLEGAMTGRVNFGILIGNMTRRSGYFYQTHYDPLLSEFWLPLRFSTEDSDLDRVTKSRGCQDAVSFYEKRYGRESNAFRVRIQGLPPSSEMDSFIPWDWIERAINRDITVSADDPIIYGVDPAYAGKDRTALCKRHGGKVTELHDVRHLDPTDVGKWVMDHYALDKGKEAAPDIIAVDTIGVGAGVESTLRHAGYRTMSVVVSESARNKELYGNRRNELWHIVRKQFERGAISIPEHKDLIDELSSIKCHPPQNGIIRVMSKQEWKKDKGDIESSSPDMADALCMTYAVGEHYRSYEHGGFAEDKIVMEHSYRPVSALVAY